MANVLFKRGDTATINGTAIADGQLLYNTTTGQHYIDSGSTRKEVGKLAPVVDTALSTTSTNAIANNAITNSIINTTAEVSAITADNIPCGTKPVKELINSLTPSFDTRQTIMTNPLAGTTYTCTEDCWIQLQANAGNNSIGVNLAINENVILAIGGASLFIIFPPFRCKKNDVIKFNSWDAAPLEVYVYKFN